MGSILGKLEFSALIQAEGRQHLFENPMNLKMVSKQPQRKLVYMPLLFEPVLKHFFLTNSLNTLEGWGVYGYGDHNKNCQVNKAPPAYLSRKFSKMHVITLETCPLGFK